VRANRETERESGGEKKGIFGVPRKPGNKKK